jgi:arsenate reductase
VAQRRARAAREGCRANKRKPIQRKERFTMNESTALPLRVLLLCTGNSARSQMAEGLLRHDGGARFEVHSAGTKPSFVRPEAIQVMAELGIDLAPHRSKHVDEFAGQQFDYIITVCDHANEVCPVFPGQAHRLHQSFEDPPAPGDGTDEYRLRIFRRVRDELRAWLHEFSRTH